MIYPKIYDRLLICRYFRRNMGCHHTGIRMSLVFARSPKNLIISITCKIDSKNLYAACGAFKTAIVCFRLLPPPISLISATNFSATQAPPLSFPLKTLHGLVFGYCSFFLFLFLFSLTFTR